MISRLDPGFLHGIWPAATANCWNGCSFWIPKDCVEGGADLLQSGGDVASALLAAAGGIRQARALKQALERKRDELAPERRTASRPFYQALDRFLEARRRTGSETLRPETWFRQQQELDELEASRRRHNSEAEAASVEIARLQRIRRVRRWLTQWTDATPGSRPTLTRLNWERTFAAPWNRPKLDVATKQELARLARETLERAEQNADDTTIDADLLAHCGQRSNIWSVRRAGPARRATIFLAGRLNATSRWLAYGACWVQLGSDLTPERAAEALPTRALLARTRQRIKDHAGLAAAVQAAPDQIAARSNDLAEVERQLAELPPIPNSEHSRHCVRKFAPPAIRWCAERRPRQR